MLIGEREGRIQVHESSIGGMRMVGEIGRVEKGESIFRHTDQTLSNTDQPNNFVRAAVLLQENMAR